MRLLFMGTPEYVVPVLDSLISDKSVEVIGVYTPPDRPKGRGRAVEMPPLKIFALEHGLPVFQPPTLRPEPVQQELAGLQPDVILVAAYGKLLPQAVLATPAHGCLNLHPSMLPKYRGPSPVVTTILEGDSATGVSLMLLDQGMDTGPVIAIRGHQMGGNETAEALTEELFRIGSGLLMENLGPWAQGELTARPQNDDDATVTRKVERDDGRADWSLSAVDLERRFRAYTPWPGLYSQWDGKLIKFLDVASLTDESGQGLPAGSVVHLSGPVPLGVVTGSGILALKTVQLEGRNSATAADFLRGYPGIAGALL